MRSGWHLPFGCWPFGWPHAHDGRAGVMRCCSRVAGSAVRRGLSSGFLDQRLLGVAGLLHLTLQPLERLADFRSAPALRFELRQQTPYPSETFDDFPGITRHASPVWTAICIL